MPPRIHDEPLTAAESQAAYRTRKKAEDAAKAARFAALEAKVKAMQIIFIQMAEAGTLHEANNILRDAWQVLFDGAIPAPMLGEVDDWLLSPDALREDDDNNADVYGVDREEYAVVSLPAESLNRAKDIIERSKLAVAAPPPCIKKTMTITERAQASVEYTLARQDAMVAAGRRRAAK